MKTSPATSASATPSLPSISEMRTALGEERRKADLSPQAADFAAEAGAKVTHNPDGSWEAVVTGAQNIRRAMDMQDGVRAVEIERGQRIRAGERTERVVDGAGRVQAFPEHIVAQVADKRGWKPKINWGRPTERYVVRDGELVRVR